MIDVALTWIVNRINVDLGQTSPPEIVTGNASMIDSGQDNATQNLNNVGIATVVNIERENTLRNQPFHRKVSGDDGLPKTPRLYPPPPKITKKDGSPEAVCA